jgi:competence protein ComEA
MDSSDGRRKLFPWLAGALLLALLAFRALGGGGAGAEAQSVALDASDAGPPRAAARHDAPDRVWVHVAGAVKRPGLYRVAADARAGAAVDAAGGLARRADLRAINLAATVRDGQQIIVPARGERPAVTRAPDASAAPAPIPAGGADGAKLSLSSATVEQLDALDGIGPTLAQRIVEWRDAHGGFQSVEQLREVDGIGEKRFEALRAAVQP